MANYKVTTSSPLIEDKIHDDNYDANTPLNCASSATIDTFGAWVELSADIGTGKRLEALIYTIPQTDNKSIQFEIAEGASSSEVVIDRRDHVGPTSASIISIPFNRSLTDNARIAIRVKDGFAVAHVYYVVLVIV